MFANLHLDAPTPAPEPHSVKPFPTKRKLSLSEYRVTPALGEPALGDWFDPDDDFLGMLTISAEEDDTPAPLTRC